MSRRPAAAGFTLLEILIALAIFASILLLLLSAFTGTARTREMLSDRYRKSRQESVALDRIGSEVAGAVASARLTDTHMTAHEDTFSSQPGGTLSFTAFAAASDPDVRPSSGLVKIRYFPKVADEGGFLDLYREQSDLPLIENRIPTREARIARRIKGFRLEYHDGSTWRKDWPPAPDKKGTLPRRIAVTFIGGEGPPLRREIPIALSGREDAVLFSGRRAKE